MVALREVGIVFGLEVSRLARNCLDWYQLLELAAAFNVLIGDEDGLYDPSDFNDRLLLGLKGTFSEIERYQITARMQRGRLNKAQRGEYAKPVPIGYAYDPITHQLQLTPDQAVRHTVEQIVHLFSQLGSMRGVLLCLNREGLQLPHQIHRRGLGTQIVWRRPSYEVVYQVLTNPIYAGVYTYGRRATRHDPLTHTRHVERRSREEWDVFLPDHHPGYLSLEQWEANMARLKHHLWTLPTSQGAPREGAALLQGLVWCQQCGARMRVRYSKGPAYYSCDYAQRASANRSAAGRAPSEWTRSSRTWCSASLTRAALIWRWHTTSANAKERRVSIANGGSNCSDWSTSANLPNAGTNWWILRIGWWHRRWRRRGTNV